MKQNLERVSLVIMRYFQRVETYLSPKQTWKICISPFTSQKPSDKLYFVG